MGHNRPLKSIYCIGDNVCTDIFGANLYNRYLIDNQNKGGGGVQYSSSGPTALATSRSIDHLLLDSDSEWMGGAEKCYSVLVETGVYSQDSKVTASLNHSPRDFLPVEDGYQEPTHVATNVLEAVDLVFEKEGFT